jgi:hypothetical protein
MKADRLCLSCVWRFLRWAGNADARPPYSLEAHLVRVDLWLEQGAP